tara:strand:- start:11095 stop:12363 length:1269 start_codon:yes stop_codon:yes gene_type:complete
MNISLSSFLLILRKSLWQYRFSTTITAISIGLATGLLMSVFSIRDQVNTAFVSGTFGFDAVLGARGSKLQLVLNAIYHLETSPGNLNWDMFKAISENPAVKEAVPYALGDNYFGYRIVGTTNQLFEATKNRKGYELKLTTGSRLFDNMRQEAVVGSFVAQKTGLKLGDIIHPYHGLSFDPGTKHDEEYVVVGIMEPSNSPVDRVIFIPIEGVFRMGGHVLRGTGQDYTPQQGKEIPNEHKEVSAILLKLKNPQSGFFLDQTINKQGKVATLAWPIAMVMAELFDKLGWVHKVLTLVAYLVVLVACASIMASVYNTIHDRRKQFAILRALGASRNEVFQLILVECSLIAGIGTLLGYFVYFAIMGGAGQVLQAQTGVVLEILQFQEVHIWAIPSLMILGAISGILPANKAYQTDVSTQLSPDS